MASLVALLTLVAAHALPAPTLAEAGEALTLHAELGELSRVGDVVRGEGGVVLQSGGMWLWADRLALDLGTRRLQGSGGLIFTSGDLAMTASEGQLVWGTDDTLSLKSVTLLQKERAIPPGAFEACPPEGEPGRGAEAPSANAPSAADASSSEESEEAVRAGLPSSAVASTGAAAALPEGSPWEGLPEAPPALDTGWRPCPPEAVARKGTNTFVLRAESLQQLGPNRFEARDLFLTTCDCPEEERPAWSLGASSARIEPGESATLYWPTFRVLDVPILIFPAIYIPLSDRRTGFLLPQIEFSNDRGIGLDLPFFLTLGRSYDLTFTAGYLTGALTGGDVAPGEHESPHSPRASVEFRYRPSFTTSGRLKIAAMYDFGRDWDPLSPQTRLPARGLRGALTGRHRSLFESGVGLAADLNAISDAFYLTDASANLLEGATPYLQSQARAFYRTDELILTLATGWFQDLLTARDGTLSGSGWLFGPQSPASYQRPALFLFQMPLRKIAGPLRGGFELTASHTRPVAAGGSLTETRLAQSMRVEGPAAFFALSRVDLAPKLRLPLIWGGPIRAELTASGRIDFSGYTPVLDAAQESFFDLWGRAIAGLWVGTELSRTFGEGERALRHTLAPAVELRASTREFGDHDLGPFETADPLASLVVPLDELDATSRAADPRLLQGIASLHSRLSRRDGSELLGLTLGQGFDFTSGDAGETFGRLSFWFPYVSGDVGARFDPVLRAFSLVQGRLQLADGRGDFLSIAYDTLLGDGTDQMRAGLDDLLSAAAGALSKARFQQVRVSAGVRIVRALAVRYGIRLDPGAAQKDQAVLLHTAALNLSGQCDCWSIDLAGEWAPITNRWGGSLLLTLKNLGSFGN